VNKDEYIILTVITNWKAYQGYTDSHVNWKIVISWKLCKIRDIIY